MIGVRFSSESREQIEAWAERQADKPTLSEAIRRLVEVGLSASTKPKRITDKARRAASLAAEKHAMDHMDRALKGETDSIKAARKSQLTSMPGGFKRR